MKGYCLECGELHEYMSREGLCNRCLMECTLDDEQIEEILQEEEE